MERPNILLITSDQQRGDTLGCAGHPCVRTPHLDMLAKAGILFTNAHVDCPICIPARTTLMTGIQSHRYGKPEYAQEYRIERDRSQFLGSLMTAAGYQTCLVGKTHWHTDPSFRGGFETWISWKELERERARRGVASGTHGIGANELSPTHSFLPPELHSTNWAVSRSIDFLEDREKEQPFFLWTSVIDPHPATVIHEPYYSMYDDEDIPEPCFGDWADEDSCPRYIRGIRSGNAHAHLTPKAARKVRGVYYGQVTNIDHQLGRLLGALIRLGLWENTVVIYSSDHGEHLGDHGTYFKNTFLEGAAHVPLVTRFPKSFGAQQGRSCEAVVEWADLLPTFCDIGGAACPDDVDGINLAPLVRGETTQARDFMHGQSGKQHMIHDSRCKYLYFVDDGQELLFDKQNDSLDLRNLAGDEALVAPYRRQLIDHLADEQNEHLVNGVLLNLGNTEVSLEDRMNPIGWMGLTATT